MYACPSITDFGVVGDGTDESALVQEAFDTVAGIGEPLVIPAGMCVTVSFVTLPPTLKLLGGGCKRLMNLQNEFFRLK